MERMFIQFQVIRLRHLMMGANQTVDNKAHLHAEIAAAKEFLNSVGEIRTVCELEKEHEEPWRGQRAISS